MNIYIISNVPYRRIFVIPRLAEVIGENEIKKKKSQEEEEEKKNVFHLMKQLHCDFLYLSSDFAKFLQIHFIFNSYVVNILR